MILNKLLNANLYILLFTTIIFLIISRYIYLVTAFCNKWHKIINNSQYSYTKTKWMPPVQYRITSICFAWLLNYPNRLTDATEKVLILHKTVQGKAYLYVLHYYILYVKTVFQCPRLTSDGVVQILCTKHRIVISPA